MLKGRKETEEILQALGLQMEAMGLPAVEILVCGGSALNVMGFIDRATKDVDVVAFIERDAGGAVHVLKGSYALAKISAAIEKVGRDFGLTEGWMNAGPESALDLGLPEGCLDRTERRAYGTRLTVLFLGRFDQICFKFYAAADQGPGKHFDDLMKLTPSAEETERAARWCRTHDPSEGFRGSAKDLMKAMGYEDVARRL